MSSVLDRLFDNTANLGNDVCDMTNRNKQNVEAANYMLENYTTENPASSALNLAMNQPNISMQASPQGGINGDNVDVNSVLVLPRSYFLYIFIWSECFVKISGLFI